MLWYIDYIASLHLGMVRLYNNLDVDGNGKLDRLEFPSQASGVFDLLDLNKDRYVTVEEIEDMIQRLEARGTQTNINNEEPVDSEEGIKTPSSFDDRPWDDSESDDNNF